MQDGISVINFDGLHVQVRPKPGQAKLFEARIDVDTGVFSGSIDETFLGRDLAAFADALDRPDGDRDAVLGGGRATEVRLRLMLENSVGPNYVIKSTITRTVDDPQVTLDFLAFGVSPSSIPTPEPLHQLLDPGRP